MKRRNWFYLFLPLILLALMALACGGESSGPFALSDVPTYPGATELSAGQNTFADLMAEGLKQADLEGATAEVGIYTIPADTGWSDITSFYNGEFEDTDWTLEEEEASSEVSIIGWTRGSLNNEQALLVANAVDPISGDNLLIIALLSE